MLLPQKAIFWPRKEILFVADLHLGKTGHFRKEGIAVPGDPMLDDLEKLSAIMSALNVKKVYFLGDLFHSRKNNEWNIFEKWLDEHCEIEMVLLRGNHDSLKAGENFCSLQIVENHLIDPPFILSHKPLPQDNYYNLCGHIHPAISLSGKALRYERLECFFFSPQVGILPAFGKFKGNEVLSRTKDDDVFVIAGKNVIAV